MRQKSQPEISRKLLAWFGSSKRDLPWRRSKDAYGIWISEVMLQQTQVEAVIPYYQKFMSCYPNVQALAKAELSQVLKVWEGMGYYARARNLLKAARRIVREYGGSLPMRYEELIKIPGIGPYTAAAVASIAFNAEHAVVDGNVKRVLARLFKIEKHLGDQKMKAELADLAASLLPADRSGDFNQAMMELGALICKPRSPQCHRCPVSSPCRAFQELDDPSILPIRKPAKRKPHYDVVVGIIWHLDKVFIDQRPTDGLLGGLWEFPGGKQEPGETLEQCLVREIKEELEIRVQVLEHFVTVQHAYTHFRITLHAFQCRFMGGTPKPKQAIDWKWVRPNEMRNFAFPRANKVVLDALLSEST